MSTRLSCTQKWCKIKPPVVGLLLPFYWILKSKWQFWFICPFSLTSLLDSKFNQFERYSRGCCFPFVPLPELYIYYRLRNRTMFRQIDQMNLPEIEFWGWVFDINTKLWAKNLGNLGIKCDFDLWNSIIWVKLPIIEFRSFSFLRFFSWV